MSRLEELFIDIRERANEVKASASQPDHPLHTEPGNIDSMERALADEIRKAAKFYGGEVNPDFIKGYVAAMCVMHGYVERGTFRALPFGLVAPAVFEGGLSALDRLREEEGVEL